MITIAAVINSTLYSSVVVLAVWLAVKNVKSIQMVGISTLLVAMILTLIRMILPVEWPFTKVILSHEILPSFYKNLVKPILANKLSILEVVVVIWALVATYRIIKMLVDYWRLKKSIAHLQNMNDTLCNNAINRLKKEYCIPENLKIVASNIFPTPLIFGYYQPTIILPTINSSEYDIYYVLRHELQHFKRGDQWHKLALEITCCIYWWNPFISIGLRRLYKRILEYNTDLAASSSLSEAHRIQYLSCILSTAKKVPKRNLSSLAMCLFENDKTLTKRFLLVLDYQNESVSFAKKAMGVGFAILLFFTSFLIVVQPDYGLPNEEITFALDESSAYIIQHDTNRYVVYWQDGTMITTIKELHESFSNLPVYTSESEK